MNDEEFRRMLEEDEHADPYEALKEDFEFTRKNWFNYITAFAISFVAVAAIVAVFLTMMSWIYNG